MVFDVPKQIYEVKLKLWRMLSYRIDSYRLDKTILPENVETCTLADLFNSLEHVFTAIETREDYALTEALTEQENELKLELRDSLGFP